MNVNCAGDRCRRPVAAPSSASRSGLSARVARSGFGTYAIFPDGRRKAGISPKPDIAGLLSIEQYAKWRIRLRNRALVMEERKPK